LRWQHARAVVLAAYTYENLRLMLLSPDNRHPDGLGNSSGQLGRHYTTKMFAHVNGLFPGVNFNRHTGPAAQGVVVDDFLAENFNSIEHGFVGGATLGAEQQFLPLQISRECLPPDVRPWGKPYRDHILGWQHLGVVRIQPDAFPYADHFVDIDPRHRDRSGVGMPLPWLQVHDTPNLHVYGGSVFPSCPGINPTLTIWAVVLRAAEKLARDLAGRTP
jgi:gluconate 2-dehydrogenase alpha chain